MKWPRSHIVVAVACLLYLDVFYVLVWYDRLTFGFLNMVVGHYTRWNSPLRIVWYLSGATLLSIALKHRRGEFPGVLEVLIVLGFVVWIIASLHGWLHLFHLMTL